MSKLLSRGITIFGVFFLLPALAVELKEGDVIDADNLDAMRNATFEGHTIEAMLPDSMVRWIKEYGLKIPLKHSAPLRLDPRYIKATEQYAGEVEFDSATKKVRNFHAGIPFPHVALDDSHAGIKLIWNFYYGYPSGGDLSIVDGEPYVVDAKNGIQKKLGGLNYKVAWEGRITGTAHAFSNDAVHRKYLLVLTRPYDAAGLGSFQIQYNDGRPDDAWVYVKAIRRVRRVSATDNWMDPQPQQDQLYEDDQGLAVYPLWYDSYRVLGKRMLLAVVDGPDPNKTRLEFNNMIEQAPPFWNPVNVAWEPREVYVIEAIPPNRHPYYSKKILYMDTQAPIFLLSENYDKQSNFWRLWRQGYSQIEGVDGYPTIIHFQVQNIDLLRQRSTYINPANASVNDPNFNYMTFAPDILTRAAELKH